MQCDGFPLENYGFHALGSLTDPEREEIQTHLQQGCDVCHEEMRKTRRVWHAVSMNTPIREPRPVLRRRILEAIVPARPEEMHGRFVWTWPRALAGLAALTIAVTSGWWIGHRRAPETIVRNVEVPVADTAATQRLEQENRDLRAKLAQTPAPAPQAARSTGPTAAELADARAAMARAQGETVSERQRSAALEAQLAQQRTLVADAQRAAQEAERKYVAAAQQNAGAEQLRTQLAALTARSQQLEREVAQYKTLLEMERRNLQGTLQYASLLSDPNLRMVRLRGTEKGRVSEGHALIAAGSQVIFYGSQLPALPANKTYQLWLIRKQSPAIVSAGLFNPDAASRGFVQFSDPRLTSNISGVAVTDEPVGGSPLPTGHKLLVGSE